MDNINKDKKNDRGLDISTSLAKISLELATSILAPRFTIHFNDIFSKKRRMERKEEENVRKIELLTELQLNNVDIVVYERYLTNELNRRMKIQYGAIFLVLTFLFSISSYIVVILNGIYDWGISEVAITALIIELPIQFVGILYIIARNLFPNHKE